MLDTGKNESTTAIEWDFVAEPFKPESVSKEAPPSAWEKKHDYGGGRTPLRIQVFSHAVGAKSGKTIFANFRDAHTLGRSDPQWLHVEEVDAVKVVLLRFVKGQLDAASLRAAYKKKGKNLKTKKLATKKAEKIVEALAAYLAATDGPASSSTFEGAVAALAQGEVATAEELEALIDHFHERLRAQRLTEAELIATRLVSFSCCYSRSPSLCTQRVYVRARMCVPVCLRLSLGQLLLNTVHGPGLRQAEREPADGERQHARRDDGAPQGQPLHQRHLPVRQRHAQDLGRQPHPARAQGVPRHGRLPPPGRLCRRGRGRRARRRRVCLHVVHHQQGGGRQLHQRRKGAADPV